MPDAREYHFGQIHTDVARNSTDDFNPFHDPNQFDRILCNPCPLPIVRGFQLEHLCAYLVERARRRRGRTGTRGAALPTQALPLRRPGRGRAGPVRRRHRPRAAARDRGAPAGLTTMQEGPGP